MKHCTAPLNRLVLYRLVYFCCCYANTKYSELLVSSDYVEGSQKMYIFHLPDGITQFCLFKILGDVSYFPFKQSNLNFTFRTTNTIQQKQTTEEQNNKTQVEYTNECVINVIMYLLVGQANI